MSSSVAARLARLERVIQADLGARGIAKLHIPGELAAAAHVLATRARVGVVTGFTCFGKQATQADAAGAVGFCETDGPVGAAVLARACCAAGKRVFMFCDEADAPVVGAAVRAAGSGAELCVFPSTSAGGEEEEDAWVDEHLSKVDCLVSIERAGPGPDGKTRNMRGVDISAHAPRLVKLFSRCDPEAVATIGIGDGGNEIGMGKVRAAVEEHINHGKEIVCVQSCDHLITAGVSNWGGSALACGMALVLGKLTEDVLPSAEVETQIIEAAVAAGARDGISGAADLAVDNLPWETHLDILKQLLCVCRDGSDDGVEDAEAVLQVNADG